MGGTQESPAPQTSQASANKPEGSVFPKAEPSIFALIVAIDKYLNPVIPDLSGCVNDGVDFRTFLEETLRVPSTNILSLLNESATRKNILTAFEGHLINNEAIHEKDVIFFFYAGHGDRVDAPAGWRCEGQMVETICPFDQKAFNTTTTQPDGGTTHHARGTPGDDSDGGGTRHVRLENVRLDGSDEMAFGIPDRTFKGLMRRLAYKKGDNIVAIFDCCHSGGVTRDVNLAPRSLPDELGQPQLPATLDVNLWSWQKPDGARKADFIVPSGFLYSGMESHVLLAACQPEQKAHEYRPKVDGRHGDDARSHGLFSFHMLQFLREAYNPETRFTLISYSRMIEVLPTRGSDERPKFGQQKPHCEGLHKHRSLFRTTSIPKDATNFDVVFEGSTLYVKAGVIHGVVSGTGFTCPVPPGTMQSARNVVTLVATKTVESLRCSVVLEGEGVDMSALHGAQAYVSRWNSAKLKVEVKGSLELPELPEHQFLTTSESDTGVADVSIEEVVDGGYVLERHDPLTARFLKQPLSCKTPGVSAPALLNALERYNSNLYRFNEAPDVREALCVSVQLRSLELEEATRNSLRPIYVPSGEDLLEKARAVSLQPITGSAYRLCGDTVQEARIPDTVLPDGSRPMYGLTLVNQSGRDLYPYVFYYDPKNGSSWYMPPNRYKAPLLKNNELPIGYDLNGDTAIEFTLSGDTVEESGFLKIIVSTAYVNMEGFVQDSLVDDAQPSGGSRIVRMKPVTNLEFWSSMTYVLTCYRP
ncbi:hypothetical protein EVJ58_g6350 [Rhodofomes roseus]|uniref:Peptidase C14 caspase domain-containing protein n=1 Tax=Rhodofomes roseus TaxID=34475 RepID=A0A4Y9Y7Q8_9APHY|nr:hypothetical protein EVJ58_g6350 [Rhodofomes roseus]